MGVSVVPHQWPTHDWRCWVRAIMLNNTHPLTWERERERETEKKRSQSHRCLLWWLCLGTILARIHTRAHIVSLDPCRIRSCLEQSWLQLGTEPELLQHDQERQTHREKERLFQHKLFAFSCSTRSAVAFSLLPIILTITLRSVVGKALAGPVLPSSVTLVLISCFSLNATIPCDWPGQTFLSKHRCLPDCCPLE